MSLGTLIIIALLVAVIVTLMRSGNRKNEIRSQQSAQAAERRWQAVRHVAEEDVTVLGQQIASTSVPESLDPDAARDFDDALGSYERAKEALAAATHPDDLQWVSKSLDDGRFALATVDARRDGRQLPNRRPPCFFDQRHGLSVGESEWAPPQGVAREVPVCAACDAQIKDGMDPQARMVPTAEGERPYYDAGPEFAPWARGWYAGSGLYVMNNVLMGTLLFNALYLPPGYDYAGDGGAEFGDEGGDDGGDLGGEGDLGGGDYGDFGGGGGFDFGGF